MRRPEIDNDTIQQLLDYTTNIVINLLAKCVAERTHAFKQHIRDQLFIGSGTSFRCIGKLNKGYLNADYKMRWDANFGNSPESVLVTQREFSENLEACGSSRMHSSAASEYKGRQAIRGGCPYRFVGT